MNSSDVAFLLQERVKELECHNQLSLLLSHGNLDSQTLLQQTIQLIEKAFQFPEFIYVRITVHGQVYETPGFHTTKYFLAQPIVLMDRVFGEINVSYAEDDFPKPLKPFFEEERNLLFTIALRLAKYFDKQEKDVALQKSENLYRSILNSSPDCVVITRHVTEQKVLECAEGLGLAQDIVEMGSWELNLVSLFDESLKSSNILIVDDQRSNVDILEGFLELSGFINLKSVTDSREVLPLMDTFQPDIVLLDLMMPHLNGFEVMAQIREKLPTDFLFPILVLTADITSEAKQRALTEGATDFITKPFDLTEVGLRIKNMLFSTFLQQQLKNQNLELESRVKERTRELVEMNHELLLAKDKAEASDRLKTAFIQNISHEIRTPLNSILGFSNLMADDSLPLEEKVKVVPLLRLSSDRLVKTIGDYVDIAKIVSGNMEVNKENMSVSILICELVDRYKHACELKNLELKVNSPLELELNIFSDPVHVRSILWQLMDNALKFTNSGSISLSLKKEADYLQIKLSDTGIGIKEEDLNHIFDIFMQRDVSITRKYEGNGLGLSIVQGLLDLLGGHLEIESEFGMGTTAVLTLPL